jgi:hypothetical protein
MASKADWKALGNAAAAERTVSGPWIQSRLMIAPSTLPAMSASIGVIPRQHQLRFYGKPPIVSDHLGRLPVVYNRCCKVPAWLNPAASCSGSGVAATRAPPSA